MDILEEIVAHKRVEIDERKRYVPIQQFIGDIKKQMEEGKPASMREALMGSKTGIIAEFKRKSPSKGWIHNPEHPHRHLVFSWLRRVHPADAQGRCEDPYSL